MVKKMRVNLYSAKKILGNACPITGRVDNGTVLLLVSFTGRNKR